MKKPMKPKALSMAAYYALVSISIVCTVCVGAFLVAVLGMKLFYHGPVTGTVALILGIVICTLTMIVSGLLLAKEARHMAKPVSKVSTATWKIAGGDFTTRVEPEDTKVPVLELMVLEENFNRMAEELGAMDVLRKDFISNVSHEFKTPIASIAGFAELLQDPDLPEADRQEYLKLIREESLRLSSLSESILNLSRLDSTEIVVKNERIAVDEQIRKAVILLLEKWGDSRILFDLDLPSITVTTDPDLLEQVWINLIDNAVKYSPEGSAVHISGTAGDGTARIVIRDEGAGIPADKLEHIYDRFYQCEESHRKTGSGLGLSIVRRIMELIGGTVSCESTEGVGTAMTVELPLS